MGGIIRHRGSGVLAAVFKPMQAKNSSRPLWPGRPSLARVAGLMSTIQETASQRIS